MQASNCKSFKSKGSAWQQRILAVAKQPFPWQHVSPLLLHLASAVCHTTPRICCSLGTLVGGSGRTAVTDGLYSCRSQGGHQAGVPSAA
jgi:hypothetical protein